jgi:hypothetical protein
MKNLRLFFILLFICFSASAQHSFNWTFQYSFSLENIETNEYKLDSLEALLNDPFNSTLLGNNTIQFNDSSKIYKILIEYGCLGCMGDGFDGDRLPPTIILKLNLTDKTRDYAENGFRNQDYRDHYFGYFPITFEETDYFKYSSKVLSLGEIDIASFIKGIAVGIHVTENGEVIHYKKGENNFPTTDKLIKINPSP